MPIFEKLICLNNSPKPSIIFSAIQSRALGALIKGTYVFSIPGSTSACKDAWDNILKFQLDNRYRPCNFIEIMPRLQEK